MDKATVQTGYSSYSTRPIIYLHSCDVNATYKFENIFLGNLALKIMHISYLMLSVLVQRDDICKIKNVCQWKDINMIKIDELLPPCMLPLKI